MGRLGTTRYSPPWYPPSHATPGTPLPAVLATSAVPAADALVGICRGALIRSSSHFRTTLVAH